ncbi:related to Putative glucan 1,3-beta-glucosidase [Phialocephala subalpina]|uniref:Related to Putative glucan 1,3-beta-glucosidase n=1 Tax=Phialocephala subalpina TaxID=576137 RepID=A0A1L7XAL5_9HELO|nr:related to Putative glucan 1,3-beta-glucosidase [Phialocephala subalpina]
MKKFFNKAKSQLQEFQDASSSQKPIPQQNQQNVIHPPTSEDVIKYRYHHGVNLGSVFVLEKWLFSDMFIDQAPGDSELDAVTAHLKAHGLDQTRQKWENHWANAVSDQDWEFISREGKCTSIRLPIGYFTLGEEFCKGTPFEKVGGVYTNAWSAVTNLVSKARSYNIGVLIDLHALPGGANSDAHSGSSTGKPELWSSKTNLERSRKALVQIASSIRGMPGVIGLQLVNEAVYDAKGMYSWYEDIIQDVSKVDDSLPIYISDAWNLNRALEWTNKRHVFNNTPRNPVIIDTHKYYTFSDKDRSQSPPQIISRIPSELTELDGKAGSLADKGEAQLIIGEYSCVLDGKTWDRSRPEEKDPLVQQFGHAQSQKWQEKAGGSYFWTWKMQWMDGGEWGFVEQSKKRNILPPQSLTLPAQEVQSRIQYAQGRRQELHHQARGGHEGYWNQTSPGKQFQHELYSEGWDTGFSDAQAFFGMRSQQSSGAEGGDKLGMLEVWIKKRLLESGRRGEFVWEWEQGFRAGVGAFYSAAGI